MIFSVEGCQPYICAQLHVSVNSPLTTKYDSPRNTNSTSHFALTAKYYSPRDTSSANHIVPGKLVGRNLEQIQVEGCKCYICARLQLGASFAPAAKYYLLKYSALRSILLSERHHLCESLGANFALAAKLQARGEPSTNVPAGDDSQS